MLHTKSASNSWLIHITRLRSLCWDYSDNPLGPPHVCNCTYNETDSLANSVQHTGPELVYHLKKNNKKKNSFPPGSTARVMHRHLRVPSEQIPPVPPRLSAETVEGDARWQQGQRSSPGTHARALAFSQQPRSQQFIKNGNLKWGVLFQEKKHFWSYIIHFDLAVRLCSSYKISCVVCLCTMHF